MNAVAVACPVARRPGDQETGDALPVSFSLSVSDDATAPSESGQDVQDGSDDGAVCLPLSGPMAAAVAQLGYAHDGLTDDEALPWQETVTVPGPELVAQRCNNARVPIERFSIVFTAYDSLVFFVPNSTEASAAAAGPDAGSSSSNAESTVTFVDPDGDANATYSARISSRIAAVTLGAFESWETAEPLGADLQLSFDARGANADPQNNSRGTVCAFFSYADQAWRPDGGKTQIAGSGSDSPGVVCTFNHTTNFAVLTNIGGNSPVDGDDVGVDDSSASDAHAAALSIIMYTISTLFWAIPRAFITN